MDKNNVKIKQKKNLERVPKFGKQFKRRFDDIGVRNAEETAKR